MAIARSVHPWTRQPLETLVSEAGARLALLMTPAGQVYAQYGFTRALDVMAAAALGAAIASSTGEIAKMANEPQFATLSHQGTKQGVFLAGFDSPTGRMLVLIIYGPESSLGLVQLFFEDFVRDIVEACPPPESTAPVLPEDFERDLNANLAALFRG